MKNRSFILFLIAGVFGANAMAQISCEKGQVGALVCEDSHVKPLVKEVGGAAEALRCQRSQAEELRMVSGAWGRQQHACGSSADVKACVVQSLQDELKYLKGMQGCELAAHPVKFASVEPAYLLAHPELFVGSEVRVLGTLKLESCEPGSPSTGATIQQMNSQAKLKVALKSVPADTRSFLCSREPFSEWRGTLTADGSKAPVLTVSEILGNPLP